MPSKVFISYNFDKDKERAHGIKSHFQPWGGKCQGEPVFVPFVQSETAEEIDLAIRRVMDGCVGAVFVTGDDVHNSPWVDREAVLATSRNVWIVAVRVDGATGGLPPALRERGIETVAWSELGGAVNRKMMGG